jgi:hypothetical protein
MEIGRRFNKNNLVYPREGLVRIKHRKTVSFAFSLGGLNADCIFAKATSDLLGINELNYWYHLNTTLS